MKVAVLYATKEGQTRRIAEHVADTLRAHDATAELFDVAELDDTFALDGYTAAVLAASVHLGKHEKEMVRFVAQHRRALEAVPTAFLSVSMSEHGAEDPQQSPESHARFVADVKRVLDEFFHATLWKPHWVLPVAGALAYTKYNFLVKWVMKRIAAHEGGSTDTSRDWEYTDWAALDKFMDGVLNELNETAPY
jgi:menaquinone-dependent protoporphyrinogen oxidase